jgi:hypothetical protein
MIPTPHAPPATPPLSAAAKKRTGAENKLVAQGSQILQSALTLAESQVAIIYLKILKWGLGLAVMIPLALLFVAFGIYGCFLLDRAADYALSAPPNPAWLSPLIRGGVYTLVMAAVVVPIVLNTFREPEPHA